MVFEPLATAEAVLTHDERELGSAAGRRRRRHHRLRLFADGEVQHSGGAADRRRPLHQRPRHGAAHAVRRGRAIKIKHGCCLASMVIRREGVSVPSVAGGGARVVPKRELCEILQPRAEELFQLVREDLQERRRRRACAAASSSPAAAPSSTACSSSPSRSSTPTRALRPAERARRSGRRHHLPDLVDRLRPAALRPHRGRQQARAPQRQVDVRRALGDGQPEGHVLGPAVDDHC